MVDIHLITSQAIHDALALRGLEGGSGFLRSAQPADYMSRERLRLAQEVLHHLPAGTRLTGIEQLVEQLLPIVASAMRRPKGDDGGAGPLRVLS